SQAYDFDQPVTRDLTLTAHWTPDTTTTRWAVTPDRGPATGGTRITISRADTGTDPRAAGPDGDPGQAPGSDQVAITGVEFDGQAATGLTAQGDGSWTAATPAHAAGQADVTISWTLNGTPQPDQHLTYTYEPAPPAMRTVTFDPAGGTPVPPQQVTDGQKAARPADPTRDGHRFNGWYDGTQAYDFDQPVTRDLTLTAHWTPDTTTTRTPDITTRPTDPKQKPAKPVDGPGPSVDGTGPSGGVLSSTGSSTAVILATGILTLTAGILILAGLRKSRGAAHRPRTR
ncbi:InlB B-repeat-containing protein, partial [Bifidobacterium favimelis]